MAGEFRSVPGEFRSVPGEFHSVPGELDAVAVNDPPVMLSRLLQRTRPVDHEKLGQLGQIRLKKRGRLTQIPARRHLAQHSPNSLHRVTGGWENLRRRASEMPRRGADGFQPLSNLLRRHGHRLVH